ncbi:hypothetical protein Plec18167_004653 [Paecilomyces lecythidis]|uniref:N-acetyltransferase domain-containing protein n=1 Tax=Paecilomyces lecythidis TaxID=3004212 RepID=A0ABR3XQ15_9EURO
MSFQIRPATEADIPEVHAINTHYVTNTVVTFLQNPAPLSSTFSKFRDFTDRGLPFLVAVDDAKSAGDTAQQQQTVIGYTYLSPFRGAMLSYGPTVELSLFVHKDHTSRGVGSVLLSALLEKIQGGKVKHLAREHAGDPDHEVRAPDGGVPIRNVIACMALDTVDGKEGGEGLRKWYEKRGFAERGRLKSVGYKKGRW